VIHIRQRLKESHDGQKRYDDAYRTDQIYKVGYQVFICIDKNNKSTIQFGKGKKL
jgi:hypothetical protein